MQVRKINVAQLCEGLSGLVLEKGKLVRNLSEYDSEREGTYSHGYRLKGTVHELKTKHFTAELTKSRTSTWNLSADSVTSEEQLRITYNTGSQCFATKNLGGEIKRFGAEEMYQGTDKVKPEPWKVSSGKMPFEMIINCLKINLNKGGGKWKSH